MIQPPLPENEEARLAELLSYGILDTESETLFDDITSLASEICDTPIALISLVDPDRQWFKSKVGLDASETHRNISFCGHAILDDELMEINDTHRDERFHDNPLVTGPPNIRFYAGTPLITPEGYALGTLCAIDSEPKRLSKMQKSALTTLGKSVMAHLELRKQNLVLRQMNTLKSKYLTDISRRFQTPLQSICTFSRLLEEETKTAPVSAVIKDSLGLIHESSQNLMRAVESVLATGKTDIKADSLGRTTIETKPFFNHIFHTMAGKARKGRIILTGQLDASVPEHLILDEAGLGLLLLKITGNAIRYSSKDTSVHLQIYYRPSGLIISVQDHGRGMNRDQLMELYAAPDGEHGEVVAISGLRRLADNVKGQIKVRSWQGRGTCVTFAVPADTAGEKTGGNQEVDPGKRFVAPFIKDNPAILILSAQEDVSTITVMLNRLKIDAETESDVKEAARKLQARQYDLLLLSAKAVTNEEITQFRQQDPCLAIVALTEDLFTEDKQLRQTGIDVALTLPVNNDTLCDTLSFYLLPDGKNQ
ncbi:ATP-binding protein [Alteromonas sp. 1_MG-2023]|uniref:GAF domain-containing sensor histidine kinase n=1 Tax=Alteromonas sp. 1_MG-2023 TaxID=3062669 RepID=UPI0026E3ED48|nr:GAF domain-containing protein [Alteromonas sp. 1_MG-2023]MDO6474810.1 ATP-binding protein [Alteromonas sp. 1_MG-2023]